MDADHFDALARSLTAVGSRRRTLVVALSAAVGLRGLVRPDHAAAATFRKCKPKCGECEKCKKGKCDKKQGKKVCKPGKCTPKPNDTPCAGTGRCLNRTCNLQPTCKQAGQAGGGCTTFNPAVCCSGICNVILFDGGFCGQGAAGKECLTANDCVSKSCVGYRCQ